MTPNRDTIHDFVRCAQLYGLARPNGGRALICHQTEAHTDRAGSERVRASPGCGWRPSRSSAAAAPRAPRSRGRPRLPADQSGTCRWSHGTRTDRSPGRPYSSSRTRASRRPTVAAHGGGRAARQGLRCARRRRHRHARMSAARQREGVGAPHSERVCGCASMGCEGAPLHFGLREAHAYGLNFTGLRPRGELCGRPRYAHAMTAKA